MVDFDQIPNDRSTWEIQEEINEENLDKAYEVLEAEIKRFTLHFPLQNRSEALRLVAGRLIFADGLFGQPGSDPLVFCLVRTDDGTNPTLKFFLKQFREIKLNKKSGGFLDIRLLKFFLETPAISITNYPETVITRKIVETKYF